VSDPNEWSSPDDPSVRPQDPQPGYQAPPPPMYGGPRYAPKPGVIPLRPLGLGEILDGAITTMRTYPKQMFGVTAIVSAISNLLLFGVLLYLRTETNVLIVNVYPGMTDNDVNVALLGVQLIALIPSVVLAVLARTFLSGLLTIVMGKAVLGQRVTTGEAWRNVRPRLGALFGVSILYTLIITGGMVALIVPGIWMYTLFSLASTALVLEGARVGRAFGRSRELISGAWWRTFGIFLVAGILTTILAYIVQIPVGLISGGLNAATGTGPAPGIALTLLIVTIGGIISDVITLPFISGVTTLVYIDRRMRREGMDIELSRQAGAAPPDPSGPYPAGPYAGGPYPTGQNPAGPYPGGPTGPNPPSW
jgi:hypothetical protein